MENRNAFFQLLGDEYGAYIKVFPALGEGENIDSDLLQSYLFRHDIYNVSQKSLREIILAREEKIIKVSERFFKESDEEMVITISKDHMYAEAMFFPPSGKGNKLSFNSMIETIARKGIKFGVKQEVIKQLDEKRNYLTKYRISEGKLPTKGEVGKIEYMFKTEKSLQPKINNDGTVDFRSLNNINNVDEGDLIAKLIPSVQGDNGTDVLGNILRAEAVPKVKLRCNRDINISEDETCAYAAADGHVFLENSIIMLSRVYEVESDVDVSTGDINFSGDVYIRGSIRSGFTVRAEGDITVDGVIEGAIVSAEGNVIVEHGVKGVNKAVISAKGDIVAKFIENAQVFSGGNVKADSIMYCNVTALGEIQVVDKKGFLVGGIIRAGVSIRCRTAGSEMETNTVLQVGVNQQCINELNSLDEKIDDLKEEQKKCLLVIKSFKEKMKESQNIEQDKVKLIKGLIVKNKQIQEKICKIQVYSEGLRSYTNIDKDNQGGIAVEGRAYIGVKIDISNAVFFVRKSRFNTLFEKEGPEIVVTNAK